jgi:hypothetical protein
MLVNDREEIAILKPTIVRMSEVLKLSSVTYAATSGVFHSTDCRAQQRIANPKTTTRQGAIDMGLEPCRNCEHPKSPN